MNFKLNLTELVDNIQDNDIFYPTKTIFLFDEIKKESVERTIKNLHICDVGNETVTIKLHTEGGCIESGLMLFDAIRAMKNYVRIIAYGGVSSMGSIIFQAGDDRVMMPDSYLMVHMGEAGRIDHKINRKEWDKLDKKMDKRCDEILLEKIKEVKPRFTQKHLDRLQMWDKIFTPEEALAFNLCSKVQEGSY